MLQSVGQAPHGRFAAKPGTALEKPPDVTSAWGTHPHGWMGERLPHVDSELWKEYEAGLCDLQRCCKDPTAAGCIVEPIGNLEAWLKRKASEDR